MRPTDKDSRATEIERNRELQAVALRHRQSEAWMSPWYSGDGVGAHGRGQRTVASSRPSAIEIETKKLEALERVLVIQLKDLRRSGVGRSGSVAQPAGPTVSTDRAERAIIDRILRIMTRRATLLGLDAPRMREMAVISEHQLDEAVATLKAEVRALEAADAERDAEESEDRAQPA